MERTRTSGGHTVAEMVVAMTVTGMLFGIVLPQTLHTLRTLRLRATALRILHPMLLAQLDAEGRSENQAMKFTPDGDGWTIGLYEDGNANGIRNTDIARGVDRPTAPLFRIARSTSPAWIGFPDDAVVNDPDTGRPIAAGTSPVNFNRSTLCSFTPEHNATPGSVYLTDGVDTVLVRSSGAAGQVRILLYNRRSGRWE